MCVYVCVCVRSSVDGHLGCLRVLAAVNSAAVNSGAHVSFKIAVSSGCMCGCGVAGSYAGIFLGLEGPSQVSP